MEMWAYVGIVLAGIVIIVVNTIFRRSTSRAAGGAATLDSGSSHAPAAITTTTTSLALKKSADELNSSSSPSGLSRELSTQTVPKLKPSAASLSSRNLSPALKKAPSEVMLSARGTKSSGSIIGSALRSDDAGNRSPSGSSIRRPSAPSPQRVVSSSSPSRTEVISVGTPPRRETRSIETPLATSPPVGPTSPLLLDSIESNSSQTNTNTKTNSGYSSLSTSTTATIDEHSLPSESTGEEKLCSLPDRFTIDYWQLLPQLGDLIGEGGYAEVYKAQLDSKTVAVKKFKIDYDALANGLPPMDIDLIRNEVIVLSRLEGHPNIMRFIGATLLVPNICIVTEFLEKGNCQAIISLCSSLGLCRYLLYTYSSSLGSLDDWLRNLSKPLSKKQRVKLALDTARGLTFMHSLDPLIIHRDIKSANVLLDKDLNGKLSDFGLAKIKTSAVEAPPPISAPSDYKVLLNSTPVGTAGWAAPEMLSSKPYNERVDIYSFGVFVWELYSRVAPWDGMDEHTLTDAVLAGQRPDIPADTPESMIALMKHCWTEQPWQRPSASELVTRLEEILSKTANE